MNFNHHSSAFATFTVKGKTMLVVMCIISAAMIVDTSYSRISGVVISSLDVHKVVPVFIIVVIIYAVGQYVVLEFIKQKIMRIRSTGILRLNLIHKIVMIAQYVLTGISIFTIFQIILTSQYNVSLLSTAMAISYTLAICMLILLAGRFFSWFRLNRNYTVLLYGLSAAILAINSGAALEQHKWSKRYRRR